MEVSAYAGIRTKKIFTSMYACLFFNLSSVFVVLCSFFHHAMDFSIRLWLQKNLLKLEFLIFVQFITTVEKQNVLYVRNIKAVSATLKYYLANNNFVNKLFCWSTILRIYCINQNNCPAVHLIGKMFLNRPFILIFMSQVIIILSTFASNNLF